jgi:hypothetical protein
VSNTTTDKGFSPISAPFAIVLRMIVRARLAEISAIFLS